MTGEFDQLRSNIAQCMRFDQHRLRRRLDKLVQRQKKSQPIDRSLTELKQVITDSTQRRQHRADSIPNITYPEALPVSALRDELASTIVDNQVTIVAGETGSGKTTQLPKICLELGRGVAGMIGHTQPRRLAASSVAQRIADELNVSLGREVGYQLRFSDQSNEHTLVKLLTDGILLAEIQSDPFLNRYDTIIIDEAHERSLNIDFLLGYLKRLLPKRPDLKVIVTSATIDVDRFSQHFDNAPVVEVSGRLYPVEMRYEPVEDYDDLAVAVEQVLAGLFSEESGAQGGDALVFLTGERDIRELAQALRKSNTIDCEILPLYARLGQAEQQRIFAVDGKRKRRVVLATNVAETSLTVPGIRYVLDSGNARISRYSTKTKVQRLPIEAISQASANQRAGRCGRVQSGVCVRLYSEQDFQGRSEFTDPEIKRTSLAAVILQMLKLGLGDVSAFPFIEAPDDRQIRDGFKLLEELAATNEKGKLTDIGKQLARIPTDPKVARMLVAANDLKCLQEVLIITAALSIQDPRERPQGNTEAANQSHRQFYDKQSDFITYINLWNYLEEQRQNLSQNQFRRLCQRQFLSYRRVREWRDIHHQLKLACRQLRLQENTQPASSDSIHRALLTGLLSQIAQHDERGEYIGARGKKLRIFPASPLAKQKPAWIMSAELLETSNTFAHCAAVIDPEWVVGINDALLNASYSEPHWQPKTARVMAYEKLSLYGLVVRDKRRVHYGPIDPVVARDLFIRHALVEGKLKTRRRNLSLAFLQENKVLLTELTGFENKNRRRDLLVDEETLMAFFRERIPENVYSGAAFEKWWGKQSASQPDLLNYSRQDVLLKALDENTEAQYPDTIEWQDKVWSLRYRFEPGRIDDGVSVIVPVAELDAVPVYRFEWLVPGMLAEKCERLIKLLPKQLRKQLVPVPSTVATVLADKQFQAQDKPLSQCLREILNQQFTANLPQDCWQNLSELEDYYQINYRVVDDQGRLLDQGRNIQSLKQRLRGEIQQTLHAQEETQFTNPVLTHWDFGELKTSQAVKQRGATVTAYPAIADEGEHATMTLLASEREAERTSRQGIARLILLRLAKETKYLRKQLLNSNDIQLKLARIGEKREELIESLLRAAAQKLCEFDQALPRDEQAFNRCLQTAKKNIVAKATSYAGMLETFIQQRVEILERLGTLEGKEWQASCDDIRQQLQQLFCDDFLAIVPDDRLQHYQRYLAAIIMRLGKMRGQLQKEKQHTEQLAQWMKKMDDCRDKDTQSEQLENFQRLRWMLEEYRVSLFAQQLGTSEPVSIKRIEKLWQPLAIQLQLVS